MGSLALDRFRLEEHLGSGSFGTVHRAWDLRLQRPVAIKAIPAVDGENAFVMREAQAVARLSHPSIVTLYELGHEDGVAYLVTELVEGETLREAIDADSLSDLEIAELGADLCEALDHAHARGVVHRDIKPSNILISDPDGLAKLMDFGVARIGDEAGLTATGDVVGTLAYMSPEQAEGQPVGPESDVYSLCLVLYECFTGRNPNRRRNPAATVRAIGGRITPLSRLRPDLPEELCAAIDLGLEPDPELRIEIDELGPALEDALASLATRPRQDRRRPLDSELAARLMGRLGFSAATIAMAAVMVAVAKPGAAILVLATCLLPALLCRSEGSWVWLTFGAPLLGMASLGSLYPALCGLAPRWRDRAVLALSGCFLAAVVQVAAGRDTGLTQLPKVAAGWSSSALAALSDVLLPLLTDPDWLAVAAVWCAAALLVGLILAPLRAWTGRRTFSRRMESGSIDAEPNSRTPLSRSR